MVQGPWEPVPPPALGQPLPAPERRQAEANHRAPAPRADSSTASVQVPDQVASSGAQDGVDEEVRLLALAYSLLRTGQPAQALATLSEHERRFPNGKLTESRRAARILALCDSGQGNAARAESKQFLATYPGSPFSNRVRGACTDR